MGVLVADGGWLRKCVKIKYVGIVGNIQGDVSGQAWRIKMRQKCKERNEITRIP